MCNCLHTQSTRLNQESGVGKGEEMNLKEYAKEMGIENITVESLIESHKRLKEDLEEYRTKRKEDMEAAHRAAIEYFKSNSNEFVSVKKLMDMTIREFIEIYGGD